MKPANEVHAELVRRSPDDLIARRNLAAMYANRARTYTSSADDVRTLTERCRRKDRSSAGFNPARTEEAKLFAAVLAGDYIARGFRNREVRTALFADARGSGCRRQSAAVGRLLKRLHVRGLVV